MIYLDFTDLEFCILDCDYIVNVLKVKLNYITVLFLHFEILFIPLSVFDRHLKSILLAIIKPLVYEGTVVSLDNNK